MVATTTVDMVQNDCMRMILGVRRADGVPVADHRHYCEDQPYQPGADLQQATTCRPQDNMLCGPMLIGYASR